MDLNLLWFLLIGVLMTGYAILDGFDLGVGILHLTVKDDTDRRLQLNSIGPLWDGNEVWLVTFGGALFAAFPETYATIFEAFYIPFMLLLFALIFRAVSIEFRSKQKLSLWRHFWDFCFSASSALATFLFGVAVGISMIGIPLNERFIFTGNIFHLLHPYALCVGVLAVAVFAMHGSIYLYLKTEGELQKHARRNFWRAFFFFLAMYLVVSIFTLVSVPRAIENFTNYPWLWIVVILNILAVANIPRAMSQGRPLYAFISSCCTIAAFVFLFSTALYPNLVTSSVDEKMNSLNIYNASSTPLTLTIMTVIAVIGMPIVLLYTAIVYWTFRGKVVLDEHSY
ncbi:Cytochrome bd-I ubiquinol oxidase subunit 2 [Poriferisphaera corsica]|uniref:Cytochrome bd-I ubiquinol oxidase subunit 2 n=1 Tax=Poriferisphaera corsica TaxID=2528020 RepID=A0A517YQN6_9BACT|nr:cytochrome d ubiquinol oxidase subunit II [Poriferisphaera corsica]QDU32539.1 Cytochrome bd-I ubiquinol oxidase subunit 2 [Poriferisphaera corsica]